jgi:hypothetical protein
MRAVRDSAVKTQFPSFSYESRAVFYVKLPDSSADACPTGTIPVYRWWNKRSDTNHRYTTDRSIKNQMLAPGYVAVGKGTDAVAMSVNA